MPNLHYAFYLRIDCPYQLSDRYLTVCNIVNDYENDNKNNYNKIKMKKINSENGQNDCLVDVNKC